MPEPNNEPSLFVIVFVLEWLIDESVVRYTQLSVIFDIEWIEVCINSQTFINRRIKQGWTIRIEHTEPSIERSIHIRLWMETIWTIEPNQIHPSSCRLFHDESNTFFLNIEFHILFLNYRHRYNGEYLHHLTAHCLDELEIRVIARGHC